jgi:DNA-binding transcriptional LysR family regulator
MDLRVLRYFVAVVEQKGITAASNHLHITQPTLSRQILELEEELGQKLFDRSARRLRLTRKGELLYRKAVDILALVEKTKASVSSEEELCGTITIAAGETPAMKWVARALSRLLREAPGVRAEFVTGNAELVGEGVLNGIYDLGLLIGSDLSAFSYCRLPHSDRWGILTAADNFPERTALAPADLAGLALIHSRQALKSGELSGWFADSLSSVRWIASYDLPYNAAFLVKEHAAHLLCLEGILPSEQDCGMRFLPLTPEVSSPVSLVWDKHRTLSAPVRKFLEILREEAGGRNRP